jgi:hypothetical protein
MTAMYAARYVIPGDLIRIDHADRRVTNVLTPRADTSEVLIHTADGIDHILPASRLVTVTEAAPRPWRQP